MKKVLLIPIILGSILATATVGLAGAAIANGINASKRIHSDNVVNIFHSVEIDTSITDVKFVPSEAYRVVFEESEKYYHSFSVESGILKINSVNERKWYDWFGYNNIKATVYMPAGNYTNLKITNSTGDVEIPHDFNFVNADIKLSTGDVSFKANVSSNFNVESSTGNIKVEESILNGANIKATTGRVSFNKVEVDESINIEVSTGHIYLKDVHAETFKSESSTGDVTFENSVFSKNLNAKTTTGDVKFIDSDAATLKVTTTTGDVTGTLLTNHRFVVETKTGKTDYPKYTEGGLCEITTTTGDIKISIKG